MPRVSVLIVDDSAVVRQVLSEILREDPGIEVLGAASDPIFARQRMNLRWPDVMIVDVEMPRMDGITFLRRIMAERPTPVVICSSLTEKGAETTMRALSAGAVEVIAKPQLGVKGFLQEGASELIGTVKAAARANLRRIRPFVAESTVPMGPRTEAVRAPAGEPRPGTARRVVAIGASTGGTQALEVILTRLPRLSPGLVIVEHMPEKFTAAFAERLNTLSEIEVKEAENNDPVLPGRALIAPGGRHLLLRKRGAEYFVEVADGPRVNRHRPSVDVLFRSAAKAAGGNALGIILTGMGDDGAAGLAEMRNAGASTIAQDERSCVVFGMPKEAIRRGGAGQVRSLETLAGGIMEFGGAS